MVQSSDLVKIIWKKKESNVILNSQTSELGLTFRRNAFHSLTKLGALIRSLCANFTSLGKHHDEDSCYPAVVFSQFTSFLDLIQVALERERFDQYWLDGTMDVKAGGVGLNVCL